MNGERIAEEQQSRTYELRGRLAAAWIKVEVDGEGEATVIGLDFERDFELDPFPGLSFERLEDDERDLTPAEAEGIAEKLTGGSWKLEKIEDGHGAVYLSE